MPAQNNLPYGVPPYAVTFPLDSGNTNPELAGSFGGNFAGPIAQDTWSPTLPNGGYVPTTGTPSLSAFNPEENPALLPEWFRAPGVGIARIASAKAVLGPNASLADWQSYVVRMSQSVTSALQGNPNTTGLVVLGVIAWLVFFR